jgi:hypothetical protein
LPFSPIRCLLIAEHIGKNPFRSKACGCLKIVNIVNQRWGATPPILVAVLVQKLLGP